MDSFALKPQDEQRTIITEAASRREVTPIIIEKDYWVCWTLRRLTEHPDLSPWLTFKGGTSLSKCHGLIARFSEDIDLTISREAPFIRDVGSPTEPDIFKNEAKRRVEAISEAAARYVGEIALPALRTVIANALGTDKGWQLALDQKDAQTIIFTYPRAMNYGMGWGRGGFGRGRFGEGEFGYIRPEIKLEFGARGENDPNEVQTFTPYLAEEFPELLPDAVCRFKTLDIERTYWEKVTILHALHHNPKTGDRLSRHYYDTVMLDRGGISDRALPNLDLLAQVVRNKSLMFKEPKASYETTVIGTIKLLPTDEYLAVLRGDYNAMSEMFMDTPPSFDEIMANLKTLEDRINCVAN